MLPEANTHAPSKLHCEIMSNALNMKYTKELSHLLTELFMIVVSPDRRMQALKLVQELLEMKAFPRHNHLDTEN